MAELPREGEELVVSEIEGLEGFKFLYVWGKCLEKVTREVENS